MTEAKDESYVPGVTLLHTLLEFRPIPCLTKNGGSIHVTPNPLLVTCPDCKEAIL